MLCTSFYNRYTPAVHIWFDASAKLSVCSTVIPKASGFGCICACWRAPQLAVHRVKIASSSPCACLQICIQDLCGLVKNLSCRILVLADLCDSCMLRPSLSFRVVNISRFAVVLDCYHLVQLEVQASASSSSSMLSSLTGFKTKL